MLGKRCQRQNDSDKVTQSQLTTREDGRLAKRTGQIFRKLSSSVVALSRFLSGFLLCAHEIGRLHASDAERYPPPPTATLHSVSFDMRHVDIHGDRQNDFKSLRIGVIFFLFLRGLGGFHCAENFKARQGIRFFAPAAGTRDTVERASDCVHTCGAIAGDDETQNVPLISF